MSLLVRGYSDDGIVFDGDLNEEFSCYSLSDPDAEPAYLAFSDGTVLRVRYDEGGVWRFARVHAGRCEMTLNQGTPDSGTDELTLSGEPITWVGMGEQLAMVRGGA